MVVALCAPLAADEPTRAELAAVLGADLAAAATFAAELLADPHPLVAMGAGLWVRSADETARVEQWKAALPAVVDTGGIPDQEDLDAWTARRTGGLIERFPVRVTPDLACLLATALATKVSWEVPFDVVDAAALGPGPWTARLRYVLRAPPGEPRHRQYLTGTDNAGTVAVHLAGARGGLVVGSVLAADPAVPAAEVLGAAEEIVTAEAREVGSVARRSLFELPLGDGPAWSISEEPVETTSRDGREEQVVSVLPAWTAETELVLDDVATGFPAAARALASALGLASFRYAARQTATARYSAVGFEAAAVTALGILASARATRPGRRRVATVRFGHPFAVVAAACDDHPTLPPDSRASPSPWHGLPVFSAWVGEPTDAAAPAPPGLGGSGRRLHQRSAWRPGIGWRDA